MTRYFTRMPSKDSPEDAVDWAEQAGGQPHVERGLDGFLRGCVEHEPEEKLNGGTP